MQTTEPIDRQPDSITLPTLIESYVDTFNRHDLTALGKLFHPQATLVAPINVQVKGREAIVDYVAFKAKGMSIEVENIAVEADTVILGGRVRCPAFRVRAHWHFRIIQGSIARLHLRLVASMQELLPLKDAGYGE
ncbi:nuclear transport factor 2 family protein [Gloeobacter violaceus]|uniref:nuclear transport factor 2 family protein n=1 Tax=Gloeobacter violaceus TaxID=33072 RepID=UPI0013E8BC94|nr:nuclear transport factor 2 family protein [Gloeobacter violaceus]